MAQLIIAAAGAAIGGALATGVAFLGLTGASIGWTVGSLIGAQFGPTQRLKGPRLDDLKVTGVEYGQPIGREAGHPRIAGQIWWASDKREIATTTEVGKGGGGAEVTSYTYEIDLLVALGNLIDNAVDAAAEGPEPRWVEVAGRVDRSSPASQMILQVTDSGSGVPPDRIGNAFTRGWSTKEYDADDRPQGRGIGLSLVSGAVRRLGGSLAVTTEPSRFELRLPLPERSDELATEQP